MTPAFGCSDDRDARASDRFSYEDSGRFPSGHTSRAFTLATVLAERHGKVAAWIAYPLATLVGLSFETYRDLPVDLGCIYRLQHEDGTWRVALQNGIEHLGPDRIPDLVPSVSKAPSEDPSDRLSS